MALQNFNNYNTLSNTISITNNSGGSSTAIGFNAYILNTTGTQNVAVGTSALSANLTGSQNTAIGSSSLASNTNGMANTAVGAFSLASNISGSNNTAFGDSTLRNNLSGSNNTAVGMSALRANMANSNTAVGNSALRNCIIGGSNTSIGILALFANISGSNNTCVGNTAIQFNVTGSNNTAVGSSALRNNLSGSNNAVIGYEAGLNYSGSESNNICINAQGVAGENNVLRIGNATGSGQQNLQKAFISGIYNVTTDSATTSTVLCSDGNQLGTISSSIKNKENVKDMGDKSSALLKLRPVTFQYKNQKEKRVQFGLIAEEVASVFPDIVVYNKEGEPESVQYHVMPAMLLNEIQKLQRKLEDQKILIDKLK